MTKVTEIYLNLSENPDLEYYFLDSENKPVKVLRIEKVPYAGKIYDVDVPNDIVLVRRHGKAFWSGNSGNRTVDISKYNNSGTCYGVLSNTTCNWTTGRFGMGLQFDGVDDYVSIKSTISMPDNTAWTVSFWSNPGTLQTSDYFVGGGGSIYTNLLGDIIYQAKTGGSATVYANIPANKWSSISVVCNGLDINNIEIFANGASVGVRSVGTSDIDISNMGKHLTNYHQGIIDEVRIYNRSLSAQEILMHYQSEFQKYNSTEYRFYDNVTNLTDATYQYYGWANDSAGNSNSTEIRTLMVDLTKPNISFVSPTPANNSYLPYNSAYINVSVSDANNITAFIDFNRSLVGWWRFNQESGENSTFFRDWSSYGNNGTCSGDTCPNYTASGKFSKSLVFDGGTDYINVGSVSGESSTSFTYSAWIKRAIDDNSEQYIITHSTSKTLYIQSKTIRAGAEGAGDYVGSTTLQPIFPTRGV